MIRQGRIDFYRPITGVFVATDTHTRSLSFFHSTMNFLKLPCMQDDPPERNGSLSNIWVTVGEDAGSFMFSYVINFALMFISQDIVYLYLCA